MFEMIDHTTTDWIYVENLSKFNWLFNSFLSIDLSLFIYNFTIKEQVDLSDKHIINNCHDLLLFILW